MGRAALLWRISMRAALPLSRYLGSASAILLELPVSVLERAWVICSHTHVKVLQDRTQAVTKLTLKVVPRAAWKVIFIARTPAALVMTTAVV